MGLLSRCKKVFNTPQIIACIKPGSYCYLTRRFINFFCDFFILNFLWRHNFFSTCNVTFLIFFVTSQFLIFLHGHILFSILKDRFFCILTIAFFHQTQQFTGFTLPYPNFVSILPQSNAQVYYHLSQTLLFIFVPFLFFYFLYQF